MGTVKEKGEEERARKGGRRRGRKMGKGKGKKKGKGKGKGKRRWKEYSLRKFGRTDAHTQGHSGDFIFCSMLCIALTDKNVHNTSLTAYHTIVTTFFFT